MTDSFGARLRRERERRNIDVADVAARTKIKACLFEALERDDVSQWPAGLFRRSFIRGYAEAVGLDPHATLREFLEQFPDPADPPVERPEPAAAAGPVATIAATPGEMVSNMRLTLADVDMPFLVGRVLADVRRRWLSAALDVAVLLLVALLSYLVLSRFWMPLAVAAMVYYVCGTLLLGNSPGVSLLAPRAAEHGAPGSEPARATRLRHPEAGRLRPAEPPRNPFRAPRRARTTRT